jgi:pyruvate formate lyase activating enzyme
MEALLYDKLVNQAVRCRLCAHTCRIKAGRRGICGVRENRAGRLESLVYDRVIAEHVDPIEKKPLFHFYPGSLSYSIATPGCNFQCRFCQNADIAQMPQETPEAIRGAARSPAEIVAAAREAKCRSIAYTYTEPTIFFELALATARLAQAAGLKNVFVTNGFMSADALELAAPVLDAANVDLKSFSDAFYRDVCGARLQPVLDTLRGMREKGIFIEVTTLVIPEGNDGPGELQSIAEFIAGELGRDTPWHISCFHPTYRLTDRPPTPLHTLMKARDIGLAAGLRYVYMGNVPGQEGVHTLCPQCGATLIGRWGFGVREYRIERGACQACGARIAGEGL